jgi:hypothetical protein
MIRVQLTIPAFSAFGELVCNNDLFIVTYG